MDYFRIDQICDVNPPKDISRFKGMEISFIPMDAVSTTGEVDISRSISGDGVKNYSVFQNRDVLFAKITPCMENGKGGIVDDLKNGFGAGSTEFIVIRPDEKKVISEWIQLFLSQSSYRIECKNHMTGSAGQKRVPPKFIAGTAIPVPSVDEQRRIIFRIEEMFSELDNSVSTLQKTKAQLAVYRQAVLREAFSACNVYINIEDICESVSDGDHMPPPKEENGIPFIMISNINGNTIDWTDTAFVGKDYFFKIDNKRKPRKGDILYTVTGSFGIPVLIDFEKDFCFQRHIALLRPKKIVDQKYLYYALMEPGVYLQAVKKATGTAQKTVGLPVLRKISVPYAENIEQQQQIVFEIESRLSVCDSIEQTVDKALQQAKAMRQSILKQAFEGRL